MKILLVDDLRNFITTSPDDTLIIARNSKDAVVILENEDHFDQMYFDHDLGNEDTIRPVVLYLEERAYFNRPVIINECIVHTDNSTGADWVMSGLKNAGYKITRIDAKSIFIVENE